MVTKKFFLFTCTLKIAESSLNFHMAGRLFFEIELVMLIKLIKVYHFDR